MAATGGYFGAMWLLADIEARFRAPAGRAADESSVDGRVTRPHHLGGDLGIAFAPARDRELPKAKAMTLEDDDRAAPQRRVDRRQTPEDQRHLVVGALG